MHQLIPGIKLRQIITGFLPGSIGASRAFSPVEIVSGEHNNPTDTMVFRLFRKIEGCLTGSLLAKRITMAKLYHFDSES